MRKHSGAKFWWGMTNALLLVGIFSTTSFPQPGDPDEIKLLQIVESVPVETDLGVAETRPTLPVWYSMLESARDSILMEFFYISPRKGEPLDTLLELLRKKAGQGTQIKILVDARMARTYPEALEELNQVPGIEVRRISLYNRKGGVMHAKYFVVDDREVFLGSQNFDWRALKHIHEIGVRVANRRLALQTAYLFQIDWYLADAPDTTGLSRFLSSWPFAFHPLNREHPLFYSFGQDTIWVYPAYSPGWCIPSGFEWDETVLLQLLKDTRKEAQIQLLTYSPVEGQNYYWELDGALRNLQATGVKIQMLVSNWNTDDRRWPYLLSLAILPNVEIRYSTIPPWSGGFIPYARVEHCKYLIVDGNWAWLGTSNWAPGYFRRSRNMSLVLKGRWFATILKKIFIKSWESPYARHADPCRKLEKVRTH